MKLLRHLCAVVLLALPIASCQQAITPRALDELVIRDSVYLDPETLTPFTGPVFSLFEEDPGAEQIRGELRDGVWSGEMTVYHENGRVRYMGSFDSGERCGPWVENRDADPPEDVLTELKQEVESMGLYPECPS